jgi:hypothetical protein
MRKYLQLPLYLFVLLFVLQSCKKGDGGGGGTSGNSSLTVSLSKSQLRADGFDEVVISVKDQNNNDITSGSAIHVNGGTLIDNKFYASSPGTYAVTASKGGASSAAINITAQDAGASPFTQKVLVEDYTGAWCGYCPRVGVALKNYSSSHPNAIVVGVHGPTGSSDPYIYQYVTQMANSINLTGWPTAVVNRNDKWTEQTSALDQAETVRAPLGIGFETSVAGNIITVKAKVKFDVTTQVPLKVIVMLVEDGLVAAQTNYYAPQYGGNPITNYTHDHTLRTAATDIFGEAIPSASQVSGNTWEKTYTINATGYNIANCKVVGTVIFDAISGRKGSLNTQIVTVGQNKAFD